MKKLVAASALAIASTFSVVVQPQATPATATTTPAPAQLRVGSFNIVSVSLDTTTGNQRPWRNRRAAVVADILGEKLDVVGIQEANPSRYYASRLVNPSAFNQFQDLKHGLNSAGGKYALANGYGYNCVSSWTNYKCVYKYRGASHAERILYNTATLSLVSQGSNQFAVQGTGKGPRYIAWAVFRIKATGRTFLFVNTHLRAAGDDSIRRAQWKQLIARTNQLKGTRPVVVVGDFNTHRRHPLSAEMLPAMKSAGYGDVLNQSYMQTPIRRPRAESTVNGWMNTWNRLDRNIANWSYESTRHLNGFNIDYVFASNTLAVKQWKIVVDYYPSTLRVYGVFPSDHNMVKATLSIP